MSDYQQKINFMAGEICVKDPSMLMKRGELLEQARKALDGTGYQYKKGKSRSKNFGSGSEQHSSKAKRPKLDHDLRDSRIKEITEELATIAKQISFKDRRVEAAAQEKNFKLCDQLTEEISNLQRNRRTLELELRMLEKKVKRAEQYKKSASPFSSMSSDNESVRSSVLSSGPGEGDAEDEIVHIASDSDTIILSPSSSADSPGGGTDDVSALPLSQKNLF